ncbi:MAG: chloride channel protein [Rhodobiaceae bacterium]|nr:chloride channel protein [Rhodobiaceae bacterium]MCC0055693.1 chloride channel protein [Rhodobiaceae bacterium]
MSRFSDRWLGGIGPYMKGRVVPNVERFAESRQHILWLVSILIGAGAAGGAILFRLAIQLFQLPWLRSMSERVASHAESLPWWVVLIAPAAGGLIVGMILRYVMPGGRSEAVAEVIAARHFNEPPLTLRSGITSAVVSAVSLGAGASAGREGPVVHLAATIAMAIRRLFRLPRSAMPVLLATGAAAAVSASFNAPIAGVIFAQEVILGYYALASFVPIVIASVIAAVISRFFFGEYSAFIVPEYQITSYWEAPAFMLLGIVCAAVAIIFQLSMVFADHVARNIRMPLIARPVVGGLMVGLIAIFFPQILGVGYETTDLALQQQLPLLLMLVLLVAKTAATAITLASRFGGGVFTPSLYLGAMAGGAFGIMAAGVFPEMASSAGLYAILGMGAVAACVLGAPISTTVIVFELTGGYALTIALLLTVAIANGLSLAVLGRSWFESQLKARGTPVADHERDPWPHA